MVALVSGSSLGLELTSWQTLGARGRMGAAALGSGGDAVHVNVATGNLVLQQDDQSLAVRGPDAALLRTYNSQGLLDDDNGDNWSHGVAPRPLVLVGSWGAAGSTVLRRTADGATAVHAWDAATASYVTTDGGGAHDGIRCLADGTLEWRDGSSGAVHHHAGSGDLRLLESLDAAGNVLRYVYDGAGRLVRMEAPGGDAITWAWEGADLRQVRTVQADGRIVADTRYGYDGAHRLVSVMHDLSPADGSIADGASWSTGYDYLGESRLVSRIVQSDGSSLAITYVRAGGRDRVASLCDALGAVTRFSYALADNGPGFTLVADPLGLVTRFDVDAQGRLVKVTSPSVGIRTPVQTFGYDGAGNLVSASDGTGRVLSWTYDAAGNPVQQRDAAGGLVSRSFDAANLLVSETVWLAPDPDGDGPALAGAPATRWFVHDTVRRLTRFEVDATGGVTEHRHDGFGQRTTTLVYTAGRFTPGAQPPSLADLEAWAAAQPRAQVQRTDLSYDARGQVARRITWAQVDANGAGVADGREAIESFVRDAAGRLLQQVGPGGASTSFLHDGLGRELVRTDARGATTLTQHDDARRTTTVTLANGLVTVSTRDLAGRLVAVSDSSAAAGQLGTTRHVYDAAGRLRLREDPAGVRHWTFWDDAGQLAAEVDGDGSCVRYGHDAAGLLTDIVRCALPVDLALLADASGTPRWTAIAASIAPAPSSADMHELRAYDAAGRLLRTAVAVGVSGQYAVTQRQYDGAGRLVATVAHAQLVQASQVAPGSIAAPVASTQDRVTREFLDAQGRRIGQLDPEGSLSTWTYDPAGRCTGHRAWATPTVAALRATGSLADLVPSASAQDQQTRWWHDAAGRVVGELDPEGFLTETLRDDAGRAVLVVRYATRVAQPDGLLSLAALRPAATAQDRSTSRTWDAEGRLLTETVDGITTRHAYDVLGRLVATEKAAGTDEVRTLLARYDVQGRLVGELEGEGAARLTGGQSAADVDAIWRQWGVRHTYDAAGRRLSTTGADGGTRWFYYAADGTRTHVVNALGEVEGWRYDALGRQVSRLLWSQRVPTAGLAGGTLPAELVATLATGGATVEAWSWARDGSLAGSTDADGLVTAIVRDAFGQETERSRQVRTDLVVRTTRAYDRSGQLVATTDDADGIAARSVYRRDAFGRPVASIDPAGAETVQAWDRLGRLVVVQDPAGGLRSTAYDAHGRVLVETDALGGQTRQTWDAATRTLQITTPEGLVTRTTSNRHGQVVRVVDGTGASNTWRYDRQGRLLQATTAAGAVTRAWDAGGRLVESVDAGGVRTSYAYDVAGRTLSRTVDPGGLALTTRWTYDARGRQVTVCDPRGVTTTSTYDNAGQLTQQVVDPGAGGLNLTTRWSWDADGRQLSVTSPDGTTTVTRYDALGRRVAEVVDPAGLALQTCWRWSAAGHLVAVTDAQGAVTRHVNDAAGRPVYVVGPTGSVTQTDRDAAGRVVRTVTYARAIALDTLGGQPSADQVRGLLVLDASDQVEHRVLDGDGRLVATVDGSGAVVRLRLDAAGRVVERTSFTNRIDLATWRAGTLPDPAPDPTRDVRQRTVHDAAGRVLYTVDGVGGVVAMTWDPAGRLLSRTAYATALPASAAVDAAALGVAVASLAAPGRDATERHGYDAAGRRIWSLDGTGAVTRRQFDAAGHLVRVVRLATPIAAGTDPATAATGPGDAHEIQAWDAAGRLVLQVDAGAAVTEFTRDAAGRVVRQRALATPLAGTMDSLPTTLLALRGLLRSDAADRQRWQGWDAAGRLVLQVDARGAAESSVYDGAGRLVRRTEHARLLATGGLTAAPTLAELRALLVADPAADRTSRQVWDAAGLLRAEIDAVGAVRTSEHDGAGRLVRSVRRAALLADPGQLVDLSWVTQLSVAAGDRVERRAYDAAGRLSRVTDALGGLETFRWDGAGRRVAFTNAAGATWTYEHDAAGRLVCERSPEVEIASTVAAAGDRLVAGAVERASVLTLQSWDVLGRLVARTEAAGTAQARTTQYAYDAAGRQVRVVHAPVGVYDPALDDLSRNGVGALATRAEVVRALDTRQWFDALGRLVASRDAGGAVVQKVHDAAGRLLYEVDALGQVTGWQRNAFGEVVALTRYGVAAASLVRPALGSAAEAVTRAQVESALATLARDGDRALRTSYDAAGRVVEVLEPVALVHDPSADPAARMAQAGRTTRTRYDAFGQVVEVRQLRNPVTDSWAVTLRDWDLAGRERATLDPLGHLTVRRHDAAGRVVEATEYALPLPAGSWTGFARAEPVVSAEDRTVRTDWDALDRRLSETRVQVEHGTASDGTVRRADLVTRWTYDAVGNVRSITDATGATTWQAHDALGRLRAVAAPARAVGPGSGVTLTPVTSFLRDALGQVVVQIEHANASGSVAAGSIERPASSADDRVQVSAWDGLGRLVTSTDAAGASVHRSYDAWGRQAKQWQQVRTESGAVRTVYQQDRYDDAGQLVASSSPGPDLLSGMASDPVVTTRSYNTFGELTRQVVGNGPAQVHDWDAAGRLWRTTGEDGDLRIQLFDARGGVTAELRASGRGGESGLLTLRTAEQAASTPGLRRTDTVRDALGRVVRRVLPEREDALATLQPGGVRAAASILSRARMTDDGAGWRWAGTNAVQVSTGGVAQLGPGDVRVEIAYRELQMQSVLQGGALATVWVPGAVRTASSGIVSSEQAAAGVEVRWADPGIERGGLAEVLEVRLAKRDLAGNWRMVLEPSSGGGASTVLLRTPDDPQTRAVLELRAQGGSADAWVDVPLIDFGQALLFDARFLGQGRWDYRSSIVSADGSRSATGAGILEVGPAQLAAIQQPIAPSGATLAWRTPSDCLQAFRWRPVGDTGVWRTASVLEGTDGTSRVDTTLLPVGSHDFELLWTPIGSSQPTARATGSFTAVPPEPARWVPAAYGHPLPWMNATPWTVPAPGSTYFDGTTTRADTAGVARISWPVVPNPIFAWRPLGGTWANAPVDHTYASLGGGWAYQCALLPVGLPAGVYEVQIVSHANEGAQGSAHVVVNGPSTGIQAITSPPYTPGYWAAAQPASCRLTLTTPATGPAVSGSAGLAVSVRDANAAPASRRPTVVQRLDRWGNVLEVSDPRSQGWLTRYRYDAFDRRVQETLPDAQGLQSVASPGTTWVYDGLGRLLASRDPRGFVNGQVWDAAGQLVEERHADGGVVRHRFDVFGQRIATIDAEGWSSVFSYDLAGRITEHAREERRGDAPRMVARWTYDALGRALTQANGAGETQRHAWDLRGNLVRTVQPMGQATRTEWDAWGRKVAEVDPNGATATWTYAAATGLLVAHTDLGGKTVTSTYDAARQLVQLSGGGRSVRYAYDGAGQLVSVIDETLSQQTSYAYDLGGRRVREKTVQQGVVYQDNHLAWDALGRLREVADGRARVRMDYDEAGNRTRIRTAHAYAGVGGDVEGSSDRYFRYDAMGRQVVVDAVNPDGDLGAQGHALRYDLNGQRTGDAWLGTRVQTITGEGSWVGGDEWNPPLWVPAPTRYVSTPGLVQEVYAYDGLGQLTTATRDGTVLDRRIHDAAGRVLRSGPDAQSQAYMDQLNAGLPPEQRNGLEMRQYRYDANGRLLHLQVLGSDGAPRSDTAWDPVTAAQTGNSGESVGYDAAGNVTGYAVWTRGAQQVRSRYVNTLVRGEGYQVGSVSVTSDYLLPGATTHRYDANGFLVQTTDATQSANNRQIVNDVDGRVLWASQAGRVQRQLVVNGELLGTYGVAVDPLNPSSGRERTPNFVDRTSFAFGYAPISAGNPAAVPGAHVVRTGDTLESIARSAYGDGRLWFRIAEANGLRGASDLRVGQTLTIPAGSGPAGNDATTFRPYDPTRVLGDLSPAQVEPEPLPQPGDGKGGCGGMGQVLMVAVAIAVTATIGGPVTQFWQGALQGSLGGAAGLGASVATGITVGAASSAAAQLAGMATGDVQRFNWRGVGMSAVSGGIAHGLAAGALGPGMTGASQGITVGRAITTTIAAQTIGALTGLQSRFDWRAVAAGAVGAAVGWEMNEALGLTTGGVPHGEVQGADRIWRATASGLAASMSSSVATGSRLDTSALIGNAVGEALGYGLVGGLLDDPFTSTLSVREHPELVGWIQCSARPGSELARALQSNLYDDVEPALFAGMKLADADLDPAVQRILTFPSVRGGPVAVPVAQAAGHISLIGLVGRALGISDERLGRLIAHSQFPDQSSATDAFSNGVRFAATALDDQYAPRFAAVRVMRGLHALNGRSLAENLQTYLLIISAHRDNDVVVGYALHALVDSIFHARMVTGPDGVERLISFTSPLGHGAHGSSTDYATPLKMKLAAGAVLEGLARASGIDPGAKERTAVSNYIEDALTRAEVKTKAEDSFIYRSGGTPEADRAARFERNVRMVADDILGKTGAMQLVRPVDIQNPFFAQPITRELTISEAQRYLSTRSGKPVSAPVAERFTDEAMMGLEVFMLSYETLTSGRRPDRPFRANDLIDTKVWSARRFLPSGPVQSSRWVEAVLDRAP